jgi:hypothetical protein
MDLPPLKAIALLKVCSRLVTLEVAHLVTSELNKLASSNVPYKEVTLDTFHLDISSNN